MDDLRHNELPAELADVARRLEEERLALSALELDRIKLQVQRREARPTTPFLTKQRGKLMKSRLAITSMLVVGLLAVEARDTVAKALGVLSGEERDAVALRFGADLTVPEIAKLLGEPLTTVEGRVYRALRKLRAETDRLEPPG